MLKKFGLHVIVLTLLFPLLFVNLRNSQDWGDDFAQYIHQARNIHIGKSQNETGYIFNENYFIGPKAYPVGFPLLLASLSPLVNDGLVGLCKIVSIFWLMACFVGFLLLRRHFSYLTALITTLIVAYNPMMINFKAEILSDLPFTFFALLCLYLTYKEDNAWFAVVTGLLLAFTVHIRTVGFICLGVYCFHKFIHARKKGEANPFKFLIITLCTFTLFYLGIKLIFPCDSQYSGFFGTNNYWINMNKQISYNFETLFSFFHSHPIKNFYYIPMIASCCLIAFSFIGLIKFIRTDRYNPIVTYTIANIIVIISFQHGDAWMRFLFPILFIIFIFAIEGIKHSLQTFNFSNKVLAMVFGAFILFGYSEELEKIIEHSKEINEGPQKPSAQKMFEFIHENIPAGTVVEFDKPRALALYTNMRSVAIDPEQKELDLKKEIVKFDIDFILTSDIVTHPAIRNITISDTASYKMVFSANEFKLYKVSL